MSRQQGRALRQRIERVVVDDTLGQMIEAYVKLWLARSDLGRDFMAAAPMPLDDAIDAVFELLNVGFLKIAADNRGFTGIRYCIPPEPPAGKICRPGRAIN